MARWEQQADLTATLVKRAEVSVLRLTKNDARPAPKEPKADAEVNEWRVGLGPVPPVLLVRQSGDDIELSVDLVSPALQAVEALHDEPGGYVAASAGVGALFGAVVGRTRKSAALGGAIGGVLGLLSALADREKK